MKKYLVVLTFFISLDLFACQTLDEPDNLDLASDAYLGRVYHVTIPKIKTDKFQQEITTLMEISQLDKLIGFSIYDTIKGEELKAVNVSIRGCSSSLISPGGYGVLYKQNGLWVFSPDDTIFAK